MTQQDATTRPAAYSIGLATAAELEPGTLADGTADHRASRLAARRAVRAALPDALEVRIERRAAAAPRVVGGSKPLALSLSHRDGRAAAIAAAAPARVGIDLERVDAVALEFARYFLTSRERLALSIHPPATMWALKEAAWKALALPGYVGFHDLELEFDTSGLLRAVSARGSRVRARATLAEPWPGYVLATVHLEAGR